MIKISNKAKLDSKVVLAEAHTPFMDIEFGLLHAKLMFKGLTIIELQIHTMLHESAFIKQNVLRKS